MVRNGRDGRRSRPWAWGRRDEETLTHMSRGRGDQDTSESLDLVVALQVEKGAHTWAIRKQEVDGIWWSIGQGWGQYLGNPHT